MLQRWRLKWNNGWVAMASVLGVGMLPCPDCGLPLAVKVWPVAGLVWLFQRIRRHSVSRLDLLLSDDLQKSTQAATETLELAEGDRVKHPPRRGS